MEPKFPTSPPQEKHLPNEQSPAIALVSIILNGTEEDIYKYRFTISNMEVDYLIKTIEEAKSSGLDLSSIENLDYRVAKLRQDGAKIAVRSCLEKAQLAAVSKTTDPLMAASWYFATLEKFDRCKDSIVKDELELIQAEIKNLQLKLGKILEEYDVDKIQKNELEKSQRKSIQIYEANLDVCDRDIKTGDLIAAKMWFEELNRTYFKDKIAENPFFSDGLKKRIDALRELLNINP
jgi:hypothetical protein